MNDEQYLVHCTALLEEFSQDFLSRTRDLEDGHPLREIVSAFTALTEPSADVYAEGPKLVTRLFSNFPEFAPTFPRLLLWFFGGDCLHYMADEEIERFQALDERRKEAAERGAIFNLAASVAGLQSPQ